MYLRCGRGDGLSAKSRKHRVNMLPALERAELHALVRLTLILKPAYDGSCFFGDVQAERTGIMEKLALAGGHQT